MAALVLFVFFLTRDLTEPWIGMHDWNGAFFSQLARNFLRYPFDIARGMPLIAVGDAIPAPDERSIYATHPPGLIWLVAGAQVILGDSEWAARMVPIAASITTWFVLWRICRRSSAPGLALAAILIYSVMPMTCYFGRMVDHEPVCLMAMVAMWLTWNLIADPETSRSRRRWAWTGWIIACVLGIWVDWPGSLFAALFAIQIIRSTVRGAVTARAALVACVVIAASIGLMLVHLVGAGLSWQWADLVAIFFSRTGSEAAALGKDRAAPGGIWTYTMENLSAPILALAGWGAARIAMRMLRAANHVAPSIPSGGWVLAATGIIWVTLFWRQYDRHNYWLFYLGPIAAFLAADALSALWTAASKSSPPARNLVASLMLIVVIAFAARGTMNYFNRLWAPFIESDIATWRTVHDLTRSADRILLHRSPVLEEQRGQFRLRNIVPPHLAYYLDRPFNVESDPGRIRLNANRCTIYLAPRRLLEQPDWLGFLPVTKYPRMQLGRFAAIDLLKAPDPRE